MILSDKRQEFSRRVTSGMNLGLSVTSERIGRHYVYLDISGIWDNILGHFGPKIGLFGLKLDFSGIFLDILDQKSAFSGKTGK